MMLSCQTIRKLINEIGLVEGFTDLETQLQQCGFDLTLGYIEKPSYGPESRQIDRMRVQTMIDFNNSQRKITAMAKLYPHGMDDSGREWYSLPTGDYVFHSAEKIKVPANIGGHGHLRSSLQRAAITYTSALFDPGFYGHLTFAVHIPNPGLKIMRGARFCQITFWYLDEPSEKLYEGIYKEYPLYCDETCVHLPCEAYHKGHRCAFLMEQTVEEKAIG